MSDNKSQYDMLDFLINQLVEVVETLDKISEKLHRVAEVFDTLDRMEIMRRFNEPVGGPR